MYAHQPRDIAAGPSAGFTLIELTAALATVGVLVAVLVPALARAWIGQTRNRSVSRR